MSLVTQMVKRKMSMMLMHALKMIRVHMSRNLVVGWDNCPKFLWWVVAIVHYPQLIIK